METDLQPIRDLVNGATLSGEVRRRVLWSLDQLPPLYRDLRETYDIRYRDGIANRVQGMLKTLGDKDPASPDGPQVLVGIVTHFRDLHDRLGLPTLILKLPPAPKPSRSKKKV